MQRIINQIKAYYPIIILVVLGSLIYSNSLKGDFVFDDIGYIKEDVHIRNIADFKAIWQAEGNPSRFIGSLSFAINFYFSKFNTFGYHLVNLTIHIINAILVYLFVGLLLSSGRMRADVLSKDKKLVGLFCALLFLCHPIQTQAVSYISQRFASLATLFYILSLIFYLKARFNKNNYFLFSISFIAALLGMFTKEIVFTLPLAIVLLEFIFLKSEIKINTSVCFIVLLSCLLVIPALFLFNFNNVFFGYNSPSGSHLDDIITFYNYFPTQMKVIVKYFTLFISPKGLCLDHDFPLSKGILEVPTLSSLVLHLAIILAGIRMLSRYPLISFGIFWFYLTAMVESSFIPIRHVIFEHRMYLPSVGLFLTFVSGCFYLFKGNKKCFLLLVALVLILSSLTFERNKVWQNDLTLWSDVVKKYPNKPRGYLNLGKAYLDRGDYKEAILNFKKTVEIFPQEAKAYNNMGYIYNAIGNSKLALEFLNMALNYSPGFSNALNNRGLAYKGLGMYPEAISDFTEAIKNNRVVYSNAYNNRGIVYSLIGQYDLALQDFNKAIETDPYTPEFFNNRGNVFYQQKKYRDSVEDYTRAIKLDSTYPSAINNRGLVYFALRDFDSAKRDLSATLSIDKNYADAYYNLALVLIEEKKYEEALLELSQAIKIKPKMINAYLQKAKIYYILKQYEYAIGEYDKVLSIDTENTFAYLGKSLSYNDLWQHENALENALKAKALGHNVDKKYLEYLRNKASEVKK